MENLLEKGTIDLVHPPLHIRSEKLRNILEEGLSIHSEVYLLNRFIPLDYNDREFSDLTREECIINHIHIKYVLPSDTQQGDYLKESIAYVKGLENLLKSKYPNQHFRISLSVDLLNLTQCVVRFHKIRENEASWITMDDLESYQGEGILVLDT